MLACSAKASAYVAAAASWLARLNLSERLYFAAAAARKKQAAELSGGLTDGTEALHDAIAQCACTWPTHKAIKG
jgi:hypothetical protein